MIYWYPAFTINWRQMKMHWWINRMQNSTRMSFSSTETSLLIPWYNFFIQATDTTSHSNIINGNLISFLWMEMGCKLGSPDKLYSNAVTQKNERAWYCFGFKKEHDDKLDYLSTKEIEVKCWLPVNHVL